MREFWNHAKYSIPLLVVMLVGMALAIGCGAPAYHQEIQNDALHLRVVSIEGCEYFVASVHGGRVYSHKGNCNNPLHKAPVKSE